MSSELPPIRPPSGAASNAPPQQRTPYAEQKVARQRSVEDERLAMAIVRAVCGMYQGAPISPGPYDVAAQCEVIWEWVTTDTWPPPSKPQQDQ